MAATLLLAACNSVPVPQPAADLPAQWQHADTVASTAPNAPAPLSPDIGHWWQAFADPLLASLVQQAIANNLDLAQARARLHAARLLQGHVDARFLPSLHFQTQSAESADAVDTFFQFGLDATWELGLFGRRKGEERVAQGQLNAALSDVDALRVSVVAEVVRCYVELRTAQQLGLLSQKRLELGARRVTLLHTRHDLGLGIRNDVLQAEDDNDSIDDALQEQHQNAALAAERLAFLLGRQTPDPLWLTPAAAPVLPPLAFNHLPADLLRTRPEIRHAEATILESAGELGIARSAMYPYIALGSAYIGAANLTQNFTFEGAFHNTPSLGPIIDIPLFDWGHRRATAHAKQAELDAAVLAYRQTVLSGLHDVENALLQWQTQQQRLTQRQTALQRTQQSQSQQQQRIGFGLGSPLQLLEQDDQQLRAQMALLEAQAGHSLAFIALYKALGGADPVAGQST